MKKFLIAITIVALLFIGIFLYQYATFSLSDNKSELLKQILVPHKKYSLIFYNYPSDATIQGSIQILIKYNTGEQKILRDFERYNQLISFNVDDTSTLMVALRDSISYDANIDTFYLHLP